MHSTLIIYNKTYIEIMTKLEKLSELPFDASMQPI